MKNKKSTKNSSSSVILGDKEYFKGIGKIAYEGKKNRF